GHLRGEPPPQHARRAHHDPRAGTPREGGAPGGPDVRGVVRRLRAARPPPALAEGPLREGRGSERRRRADRLPAPEPPARAREPHAAPARRARRGARRSAVSTTRKSAPHLRAFSGCSTAKVFTGD